MSTLQTARYEQFLRRLFRLVEGGVLPRMQNDVSPVINIEDPADDALLFWKGHRLASGVVAGTAAVAEFGTASLFNPLGSGKLVVVRAIRVGLSSPIWTFGFTQDRTGTVQSNLRFSDTRAALTTVPTAELGFDSEAALPTVQIWRVQTNNATAGAVLIPKFVLAPGTGLQVANNTTNNAIVVNFQWLERTAEDSELRTV